MKQPKIIKGKEKNIVHLDWTDSSANNEIFIVTPLYDKLNRTEKLAVLKVINEWVFNELKNK